MGTAMQHDHSCGARPRFSLIASVISGSWPLCQSVGGGSLSVTWTRVGLLLEVCQPQGILEAVSALPRKVRRFPGLCTANDKIGAWASLVSSNPIVHLTDWVSSAHRTCRLALWNTA